MGARTAAAFRIDQNNVVAEYTVPERAFKAMFGNRVDKPNPILVVDDEGSKWSLKPDFIFVGTNVLAAVDGVYHRTRQQERKTKWEDEALNEKGFRIIHIDSELLTENFLLSELPTKRLAA